MGGLVAQSLASLTAEHQIASLIPALSQTFVEIDHEIISTVTSRVVVSHMRKYVHKVGRRVQQCESSPSAL